MNILIVEMNLLIQLKFITNCLHIYTQKSFAFLTYVYIHTVIMR